MNIEAQITELLAKAAPLRGIHEDDPRHLPLAGIVNEINRLRAVQQKALVSPEMAAAMDETAGLKGRK